MTTSAVISHSKNEFIAQLSDGRHIRQAEWHEMAEALFCAGVSASQVDYEWHTGQRMITAGQKAAIKAEIRRLGHVVGLHDAAA